MSSEQSDYTVWLRCIVPDALSQVDAEHAVLAGSDDVPAEIYVAEVSEEMVERAAEALCGCDGGNWDVCECKSVHRTDARAALEAVFR